MTARLTVVLATLVAIPQAAGVAEQLPDPYVVPRGALRVSFQPSYTNYDLLLDVTGAQVPLGTLFSTDTLGVPFLPTLAAAEGAVRSITGDATYRMNAGAFRAEQDADIRRFPFEFGLGISNRITLSVTVPIVTTRVNSVTRLDTAGANVGWNQVASPAGNPGAAAQVMALLMELETTATTLDAEIAAGSFGCPSGAMCDLARDASNRARSLTTDLSALTGVDVSGGTSTVPPFAPQSGSVAGMAIVNALAGLSADLQALGQAPVVGTLPLPGGPSDPDAVNTILTTSGFGYDARTLDPAESAKLSRFGDLEVGMRYALATGERLRAVVGARARLPTGVRDFPNDFLDIGPGDKQLDLEWTFDAAVEPGSRLGVWVGARYTMQLGDRLVRRVAPPDNPLAPVAAEMQVDRNLGDSFQVGIHPLLRLDPAFRVFVSATYFRRGSDRYSVGGTAVPELEALTEMETWSFGAGVWYRVLRGRRAGALPIEAGVAYRSVFSGDGGRTPKQNRLDLSLRLYYRLWGGAASPPDPALP